MKYLPLCIAATGMGIAVVVGLVLTHDPSCLWGLAATIPIGVLSRGIANAEYEEDSSREPEEVAKP